MNKEVSFHEAMKARSEGKTIGAKKEGSEPEWFKHDEPINTIIVYQAESMPWFIKQEPRTFYISVYPDELFAHNTTDDADLSRPRTAFGFIERVKVVEVFDEEKLK